MQTKILLKVSPQKALNEQLLKAEVARELDLNTSSNFSIKIIKRSIDARSKKLRLI